MTYLDYLRNTGLVLLTFLVLLLSAGPAVVLFFSLISGLVGTIPTSEPIAEWHWLFVGGNTGLLLFTIPLALWFFNE